MAALNNMRGINIRLVLVPQEDLLEDALQLALDINITVYDALVLCTGPTRECGYNHGGQKAEKFTRPDGNTPYDAPNVGRVSLVQA